MRNSLDTFFFCTSMLSLRGPPPTSSYLHHQQQPLLVWCRRKTSLRPLDFLHSPVFPANLKAFGEVSNADI